MSYGKWFWNIHNWTIWYLKEKKQKKLFNFTDLKTSKPHNSVNNSAHEVFKFKSYIENSDPNDEAATDSNRKLFNYRSLSNKFNNSLRNQEKQTRLAASEVLISSLRHTKTAKSKKKDKEEFQRKLEKKYNNNVEVGQLFYQCRLTTLFPLKICLISSVTTWLRKKNSASCLLRIVASPRDVRAIRSVKKMCINSIFTHRRPSKTFGILNLTIIQKILN